MTTATLNHDQLTLLATLADGIIPPDERDAGAASVNAGPKLAEKIRAGVNTALYLDGLRIAESVSADQFEKPTDELDETQIHELLAALREKVPAFFKQLRMDVSSLYLSDPSVWERIGFPGPSFEKGGYPDFDQPQQ